MGAKIPDNAKEKRLVTCDDCQKDFQTIRALKSHTIAKHPEKQQFQSSEIESKDEKKTALVTPTARSSKRLQQKKSIDKEIDVQEMPPTSHKTVFECPECERLFHVYFSAYKHIQNRHCNDKDGNPVSSDSSELIKPIRKEICTVCGKQYGEEHTCEDVLSSKKEYLNKDLYCCLGCKKSFMSLVAFDKHIPGNHYGEVETLFFENNTEFLIWKSSLESQLKVKYLTLSTTIHRQYYQCNYVSTKNSANITHLCPSVVITQEFSKGIQVYYYKKHYEHMCEYKLPKRFENYIVNPTQLNDDVFDSLLTDDTNDFNDLYPKFKNLLNSIILGAASINIKNLKKLYSTAVEMQTCLNSYDEDHADSGTLTNINYLISADTVDKKSAHSKIDEISRTESTDKSANKQINKSNKSQISKALNDPIAKALEGTRVSARLKRKSESSPSPVIKKMKLNTDKNDGKTKPGLKENNSITRDAKLESPKINKASSISQSPSFNDTYKQFIDSALGDSKKEPPISKKTVKKEIVKTKMGQFLPSPKKVAQLKMDSENVESTVKKSPKSTGQINVNSENVDSIVKMSPKSTGLIKVDSENVDSIVKKSPRSTGQIKVNSENVDSIVKKGPKKAEPMRVTSENVDSIVRKKNSLNSPQTSIIANIKLEEVDYEVVEQEDDCNILVLKI